MLRGWPDEPLAPRDGKKLVEVANMPLSTTSQHSSPLFCEAESRASLRRRRRRAEQGLGSAPTVGSTSWPPAGPPSLSSVAPIDFRDGTLLVDLTADHRAPGCEADHAPGYIPADIDHGQIRS